MNIKTYHKEKELKMAKASTKNRIKNMQTFQSQERRIEPISEEHKYMIALMRQKESIGNKNEDISRISRRPERSQYI
jgi:hypothetical protein|tara:strand:+ start:1302 stop:1532 length:231 start_codon:yes stop_codon:yes gene_type:complete